MRFNALCCMSHVLHFLPSCRIGEIFPLDGLVRRSVLPSTGLDEAVWHAHLCRQMVQLSDSYCSLLLYTVRFSCSMHLGDISACPSCTLIYLTSFLFPGGNPPSPQVWGFLRWAKSERLALILLRCPLHELRLLLTGMDLSARGLSGLMFSFRHLTGGCHMEDFFPVFCEAPFITPFCRGAFSFLGVFLFKCLISSIITFFYGGPIAIQSVVASPGLTLTLHCRVLFMGRYWVLLCLWRSVLASFLNILPVTGLCRLLS